MIDNEGPIATSPHISPEEVGLREPSGFEGLGDLRQGCGCESGHAARSDAGLHRDPDQPPTDGAALRVLYRRAPHAELAHVLQQRAGEAAQVQPALVRSATSSSCCFWTRFSMSPRAQQRSSYSLCGPQVRNRVELRPPLAWWSLENGERAGTRTPNLVIKSHLLYQLSYAPTITGPAASIACSYWPRRIPRIPPAFEVYLLKDCRCPRRAGRSRSVRRSSWPRCR